MPVVKTVSFHKGTGDMVLSGKYTISVDSEGHFSTVIPEDIVSTLESVGIGLERNGRSKKAGWVYADTLDGVTTKVSQIFDRYLSKELVSSEIVLKYQIGTSCSYMIDEATGEFIPNGAFRTLRDDKYEWLCGNIPTSSTYPAPYGLQVYVQAIQKEVYKFLTGATNTQYVRVAKEDHELHPDLLWLMGVCSIKPIDGQLPLQEIPATPENCAFFVSLLKSIFAMNERIKDMLTPEKIQELAHNQVGLLGGPT